MRKVKINYDQTYSSKYGKDYYRGKSFHYAGRWTLGARYVSDEYNTDFISYNNSILVCKKNHTATIENEPQTNISIDNSVHMISDYWDVVIPIISAADVVYGIAQNRGDSVNKVMSQKAVTDELVGLEEAIANNSDAILSDISGITSKMSEQASSTNKLMDKRYIDSSLEGISSELEQFVEDTENDIITRYRSEIQITAQQLSSTFTEEINDAITGVTANYRSEILQTAREIRSTISANKTSTDGEISRVESKISQTAGEIILTIDSYKEDINGSIESLSSLIDQTPEKIRLAVSSLRTTLEGEINSARSEFSITANQIRSLVEQTTTDLTGRINTLSTTITQTAGEITAVANRVETAEGNITRLEGSLSLSATNFNARISSIETNYTGLSTALSELNIRVGDITTTVTSNKQDADGKFSSLSTRVTQTETDIDSISTRITSAEGNISLAQSSIEQNAENIALRVLASEYNSDKNTLNTRLSSIEQNANQISLSVSNITSSLSNINDTLAEYATLQDQIDGAIVTWYSDGEPTLSNSPASDWSSIAEKDEHIGDLYYDKLTGFAYRFFKERDPQTNEYVYSWVQIQDTEITRALGIAAEAKDTADGKRRVFTTTQIHPTPYPPYDEGDLWVTGSTNNKDGMILYCVYSRPEGSVFVSSDWQPASDYTTFTEVRSNFDIFADAIQSTVGVYDGTGNLIDNTLWTKIRQARTDITLEVAQVGSDLLATGINIADRNITLTADHIWLKNNSGTTAALNVTTINNVPVIDVSSLNISGIFSTSAWNSASANLLLSAANDATNKALIAENNAKTYANSTEYLNAKIVPLITAGVSSLAVDSDYSYLKTALQNDTTIAGGLILSTLIQLGSKVNDNWTVYSGINGGYLTDTSIAAWFGGDMAEIGSGSLRPAKTVFRMDGSGYLASKNIYWDNHGNATFTGAITATSLTIGSGATISGLDYGSIDNAPDLSEYLTSADLTGYLTSADLTSLQQQIDKKAETWVCSSDPATNWTSPTDVRDEHVGDMWLNTSSSTVSSVTSMGTAIYTKNGNTYSWIEDNNIPNELFDKIDGKASIYVSQPTSYKANDLWILASDLIINGISYKSGEILVATISSNVYNAAHWVKKISYTDNSSIQYLISALSADNTIINGGLVLSNFIGVKDGNNVVAAINSKGSASELTDYYDSTHHRLMIVAGIPTTSGTTPKADAAFRVFEDGAVFANSITLSNGVVGSNSTNGFIFGTDGNNNSYLRNGMLSLSDTTNNGIYLGTNGIALGAGAFKVGSDGTVTATSGNFGGTYGINITSSGITIGGSNGISINTSGVITFGQNVPNTGSGGSTTMSRQDIINLINGNSLTTTIDGTQITTGSITTNQIAAGAITAAKIDTTNLIVSLVDVVNNGTRIAYIGDTSYPIYAGGTTSSNATFKVSANGDVYANRIILKNGIIGDTSGNNNQYGFEFGYDTTGTTPISYLRNGMLSLSDTTHNGIYLGTDGIALGQGKFKVTSDGTITATGLTVTSSQITDLNQQGFLTQHQSLANYMDKTTYIVGGYIDTGLINADALTVKNVLVNGTNGGSITITDGTDNLFTASASGVTVKGAIVATSLTLGSGVTIDASQVTNLPQGVDLSGYISKDGKIGTGSFNETSENVNAFKVSTDGLLQAKNAIIYGTIYASDGRIGGLTLSNNALSSTNFSLSNTGVLTATNADISGTITSSFGTIGGFSIGSTSLHSNAKPDLHTTNSAGVYLGTDGIALGAVSNGHSVFEVDSAGNLYASSATISGTITANRIVANSGLSTETSLAIKFGNAATTATTDPNTIYFLYND